MAKTSTPSKKSTSTKKSISKKKIALGALGIAALGTAAYVASNQNKAIKNIKDMTNEELIDELKLLKNIIKNDSTKHNSFFGVLIPNDLSKKIAINESRVGKITDELKSRYSKEFRDIQKNIDNYYELIKSLGLRSYVGYFGGYSEDTPEQTQKNNEYTKEIERLKKQQDKLQKELNQVI